MIAPAKPSNELERLAALRRYEILDSAPEADFDAITALIASICETPIAMVSLLDEDRQWFKSRVGIDIPGTPRDISFCGHAILEPDRVMVVPDATADERFADNPAVTGDFHVRSYAGVPLVTHDGYALGTLCVVDTKARELSDHQLETLRLAGRAALMLIEQRKTIARLQSMGEEQRRVEAELRAEIAHRRHVEQQLSFSCSHDGLTRLPNRAEFMTRLEMALGRLRDLPDSRFAVMFIDLDRFKSINDTLGHPAGDELLVEVGRRLTGVIRSCDVVARLGGDEFTMLIDRTSSEAAAHAVAQRVADTLGSKLRIGGVETSCTASVGVVLVDDGYCTVEAILRDADIAMYASKDRGRNRATVFTSALRDQFAHSSEMSTALRTALDQEAFVLAYQPIVSLQPPGDGPCAFEALLRWQQEDGTLIGAADFIATAEQTGLIVELGDRILREACAQAQRWQAECARPVTTAVNVSARQLVEPDFGRKVREIVLASGLDPRRLALEVTESILIADVEASLRIIEDLRCFGVNIYLDDFGTGYSSLNYLRKFPLDRIKIDRSFVSGAGDGLADPIIVHSIVSLAHKLGLCVVAEGVETECQRRALADLGCDYAQGYLFSRAVSAANATSLLQRWSHAGSATAA